MEIGLEEVVKLLRVPEATVSRWVRQGYIPCTYRDGHYLFNPATLRSWARSKQIHFSQPRNEREPASQEPIDLILALKLGGVHHEVPGRNKQEIFAEIEKRFDLPAHPASSLANQLMQRENLAPTAIGQGIAIPHPRYPQNWGLGAAVLGVFFLATPFDFGASDQIPVYALFALLSATSQIHLQLLAKLAQILHEPAMGDLIKTQPTSKELVEQFKKILAQNNQAPSF